MPDAVILGTASGLDADLLTDNIDDFAKVDSSVNLIDLDRFKFVTN